MDREETEFWLVIQSQGRPDQTFALEQDEVGFGRDPRNALVFDDPEISRQHGRFIRQPEGYLLEDLASLNGTYLNGKRLAPNQPRRLYDGDTIGLTETLTLTYRMRTVEPEEPISPPAPAAPAYDPRTLYSPPPPEPAAWAVPEAVAPEPAPGLAAPEPATAYVVPESESALEDMPPARTGRLIWGLALAGCLLVTLCLAMMAALVFVLRQRGIL